MNTPRPTIAFLTMALQELEATRPEMPRGLPPEHPEFVAWHRAFQIYVDRKARVDATLNVRLHPVEINVRPARPLAALPRLPSRIRQ